MSTNPSSQAEELLAILPASFVRELDAVDRQAVVAYLQALRAGRDLVTAFDFANDVLVQAGRPPLNWEEYARQGGA